MISEATVKEGTRFTPTKVQQQVFTLSWYLNKASQTKDPLGELNDLLHGSEAVANIGAWEVVWGPSLYAPPKQKAVANVAFVAQAVNAAQPTYVIAIGGTNPFSPFDWFSEDLDITPIDWPYALEAGQVTTGDATGLGLLLFEMEDPKKGKLQDFLSSIPDKSNASLTFTGHSLGGALAPMLTLALMDPASSLDSATNLSIGNWAEVSLLATAGPSIGDAAFVQYFNKALAGASRTFIWNGNDIVPHAWNKATMMELTSPTNIYNLDLKPTACLAKQIARQQANAAACSYTQFEEAPAFAGTLQPYTQASPRSLVKVPWFPGSQFLAQALYQHEDAYALAFNCTGWIQLTDPCAHPGIASDMWASIEMICHPIAIP